MTQAPPQLTDRAALAAHRARACRRPGGVERVFHDLVADELQERLAEVNRVFTSPALVTPFPDAFDDLAPWTRIVPDDEVLALDPGAHDLVIHALALHWASDPVGQLVQCRRALRPDGLMIAAFFGGQSLHELRACLAEAEVALAGGLSPRVLAMAEIRDAGALLQRAGFALPVADARVQDVTYPDPFALMADLRAMGETNALAARDRRVPPRALFARAASAYAARFGTPDGRVRATAEILFLTGWAPGPGQPQPLRPGSATARLADALGSSETALSGPATGGRD